MTLQSATRRFAAVNALDSVSLAFNTGAITAIIGRSGCGKSTLLKLCNGLERPDEGDVCVYGEALDYASLPAIRRRIGYAVQGVGLFPHLSARDNITLLARLEGWSAHAIDERLAELVDLTRLEVSSLDRYPHELSGGQQQRVGLCRAMVLRPGILLLDEPFAAIDPVTRLEIHEQLLALHSSEPATTILVTHDMAEALRLADYIVVMDSGRVIDQYARDVLLARHEAEQPERLLLSLLEAAAA